MTHNYNSNIFSIPTALTPAEWQSVISLYRAFADGAPDLLDQALAPDWEDIPLAPGQAAGPERLKAIVREFRTAVPDLQVSIHDALAEAGRIAVRAELSGTHQGAFLGVPATGLPIRIVIHEFHELREGRIARTWHLEDLFGALAQIGAWPPAK